MDTDSTRTVRSLPIDPGGPDGPDVPDPYVSVQLNAIAAVTGAQPGVATVVTGTYTKYLVRTAWITVTADGHSFPATLGGTGTWSATVRFYRSGSLSVTAHIESASGEADDSPARTVPVTLSSTKVDIALRQPSAGAVQVGEAGVGVALQAATSAGFGPRQVTWTASGPGGSQLSGTAAQSQTDQTSFTSTLNLPAVPLGAWTVTMRATALLDDGSEANPAAANTASVSLNSVDAAPPHLDVRLPASEQVYVAPTAAVDVPVALTATDVQSHVARVTCSVDGAAATQLLAGDGSYGGTVHVTGYGRHILTFTAVDKAPRAAGDLGGTTVVAVPITLRSDYVPATLDERLDDRAYLSALLDFTGSRVVLRTDVTPAPHATVTDLERLTSLRLGDLTQPTSAAAAAGNQPVSRLQLAVEALRRYLGPDLIAGRWDFTGPTGSTTVPDLSGHQLTLTLSGTAKLGAGPSGRAALVMDANSSATAPTGLGPRIGDAGADYTVAFWINVAANGTGAWRKVMQRGNLDSERTFAIWLRPNDNGLHVRLSTTTNTNDGIDSTSQLAVGRWTHVTCTKAGNRLSVYLDGRLDTSVQLTAPSVGNNGPFHLGKDTLNTGFSGSLAAVEVLTEAVPDTLAPGMAAARWPAPGNTAAGLRAHGDTAYEALLAAFGTSSAELRLSRGAPPEVRADLASRFGIRLSATTPDELTQLIVPTGARTEAILEKLFGLPSTDPSLPSPRVVPTSDLSRWREAALNQRWSEEDLQLDPAVAGFGVLIDPDVITADDLTAAGRSGVPGTLLAARKAEVAGFAANLHAARIAQTNPAAALAAVVALALPGVNLAALETARNAGQDISATLAAAHLSDAGFTLLRTVSRLADHGTVQDDEWADVEALTTRVMALGRQGAWRTAEAAVALTPTLFVDTGPTPAPARWRTDSAARAAWLRRLRSRIAELAAYRDELGAAVASAQAAALPGLRNTLLAGLEGPAAAADVARWLDVRLSTDVLVGSGSPATTRVRSATEVIQSLINALRGGRVPAWHPARSWCVDDETRFDTGWTWLADQAGWIAAMLTWLYPENVLAPELLPVASPSYASLVDNLRGTQIAVDEARARANEFLGPLRPSIEAGVRAVRARWALDDNDTGKAKDVSGAGLDLVVSGARSAPGLFGSAMSFDGTSAVVNLPDTVFAALKPITNDFTLSFWACPTAPHEIDPQATSGATGGSGQRYALGPMQAANRYGDPGAAGAGVSVGTNGISVYEHSDGYLPAILVYAAPITGWTHVTVVYAGRQPRLYVNGVQVAAAANPSAKATVYACPDQIGGGRSGDLGGGTRVQYGLYQGLLADVRLYQGALNLNEIAQISFLMTEERSTADIQRLQQLETQLLSQFPSARSNAGAAALREAFWFAPVLIAQTLAGSGQYAAALDWFQLVYSLDLPPGRRAVYPILAAETNTAVDVSPVGEWLSALNPHQVALSRPSPYTRYTLAAIAQCLLDYGDSEFARGQDASVANARALYDTAADIMSGREFDFPGRVGAEVTFPNPAVDALRSAINVRLAKLRQGRDLAGVPRVSTGVDSATTLALGPSSSVPSSSVTLRPTPYRYKVLQDRARQMGTLAQQVEQEYLSAIEKYDAAQFKRFDAQKGVEVAQQNVQLQQLRITEADDGLTAAADQKAKADYLVQSYTARISAGLNRYERAMLQGYQDIRDLKNVITGLDAAISIASVASQAASISGFFDSFGAKQAIAGVETGLYIGKGFATGFLNDAEARLSANSLLASHENQVQDWRMQVGLAQQDALAAQHAQTAAADHRAVVVQEQSIAELQAKQADATLTFLDRQFTNAELYAWMVGVLGSVYRYFLQLATTTAALAQQQLAFERQDVVPSIIQADYWQALPTTTPSATGTPQTAQDRRGLTGAERLLQDITRLDQYAFETDRRRLNLTQTFSLADRLPRDFYEFRQSGRLSFATPMAWFDECFPGHLLRLIKRVRISVVGLIPPNVGVRATLTSSGISRAVLPSQGFPQTTLVHAPESVALTSPVSASGVFDLDAQPDLLLPFEGTGVDTRWTFDLPQPANPFDYRSLADVLITIEYTATSDPDYRDAMLRQLADAGRLSGDRVLSLRTDFVDQFYELNNPSDPTAPRQVTLTLGNSDFPSLLSDLQVEQVVVSLVADGQQLPPVALVLQHAGAGGSATTIDGIVSTRRGNGGPWAAISGSPLGAWTLSLDPAAGALLDAGAITDVLLDIGYSGARPAWPR